MIINQLFDSKKLQPGDPVIVLESAATGIVADVSPSGKLVEVTLDNNTTEIIPVGNLQYDDQRVTLDEKQDACYRKVKSRYKVWPSAYASGALVQCRKKGAANWGNKSESVEEDQGTRYAIKHKDSGRILSTHDSQASAEDEFAGLGDARDEFKLVRTRNPNTEWRIDENLRKWFKEKWVRFGPDGKIRGSCARGSEGEGKPKCLPQAKAHALGKKGRASAAAKKRREDPNPERRGKAKNVATKVKEEREDPVFKSHRIEVIYPEGKGHSHIYHRGEPYTLSGIFSDANSVAARNRRAQIDLYIDDEFIPNYEWQDGIDLPAQGIGEMKLGEEQLDEKCWDGYKKQGMKRKGDRMVPNCVPVKEESAIDKLEQRRIADLNDKMDGIIARISRERITDPDVIALLMKQYDHYKDERDSYYRIREAKQSYEIKLRDPNYKTLTAKRTSGASGEHKNKRREQELGRVKHKGRELDLAEASKAKTVAKLAPAYKLFQATIRVKMPDYTGLMDVNVTAPNINMARQMVKAMYSIQNSNVVNVKEVKALREGWSDKYGGVMNPPTPYGVYIDGKQWKEFTTDDHARAVADKVRASLKAQGRNQSVTIAPARSYLEKNIKEVARVEEEWSEKYKRSINCNNPKGFSQKAHCAGRKKNEDVEDETDLKPGEYYIWTVYFDDGTHKRIKVTSDEFDPYTYYADRDRTVVNVEFNWDKHK